MTNREISGKSSDQLFSEKLWLMEHDFDRYMEEVLPERKDPVSEVFRKAKQSRWYPLSLFFPSLK